MRLRHGNRSIPAWLQACVGPFLALIGLIGAVAITVDGALTFVGLVRLAFALLIAVFGVWMTVDTFWRRK